jgi:hypothetical protein
MAYGHYIFITEPTNDDGFEENKKSLRELIDKMSKENGCGVKVVPHDESISPYDCQPTFMASQMT